MALSYVNPRKYNQMSRYGIYNQILDNVNNNIYLESYNKTSIDTSDSTLHIVSKQEEGRLDIISNMYYGTPDRYWAIAMANDILDPLVIVAGTILKIPSYESLFKSGGPLISRR